MTLDQVRRDIRQNADRYIVRLQAACRQPSISTQDIGMAEMGQQVIDLMEEVGLNASLMSTPGYPVAFGARQGRSARRLLLYNHYDVQPPDPVEDWSAQPFAAEVRDGLLFARGVADNKGNLIARLCAIESTLRVMGELPITVLCLFEGEEEMGSPHLGHFVENNRDLLRADGCLWETASKDPQGRLEVTLGLKGILYVELTVRSARTDVHSSRAPILPNSAWRLVWALESLKGRDEVIRVPGFYRDVQPPSARQLELVQAWPFDEASEQQRLGIPNHLSGLTGMALKERLIFGPTCTICGLQSGYGGPGMKTVLPHVATAKVDFRLVPDQDPEAIFRDLRDYLDRMGFSDVEAVILNAHPAYWSSPDDPLVQAVIEAARHVYDQPPVLLPTLTGSGPIEVVCQTLGIPVAGTGVRHPESNPHAPNESIRVEDFIQGIEHAAAIFDAYAR
jgi:acetylornithine deacetylase/succinyl-diaminopimelate desuccinylase-like protein